MTNETITALLSQIPKVEVTIGQALTRKIRACEGEAAAQLVLEKVVLDAMRTAVEVERDRCLRIVDKWSNAKDNPSDIIDLAIRKGEIP
jgi:uncharacterized protein YqgV (UPF0045/DUF77 family)